MADQRTVRVLALADKHLVVNRGFDRRLFFPRMAGKQVGDRFGPRILSVEVEGDPCSEQRAKGLLKVEAGVAVPHQRLDAGRLPDTAFQALRDSGLQRAVRGDFQHCIGAIFALDGFHRRREPNGLADIRPPIGAVQPRRDFACDRGNERHVGVGAAVVQERQSRQRGVADRFHGGGVEGDVSGQQYVLQTVAVEFLHHGSQDGFLSADDSVGGCVHAGDLDRRGPAVPVFSEPKGHIQGVEQFLHARPVKADGQQSAGPRRALLQGGAVKHQTRRFR